MFIGKISLLQSTIHAYTLITFTYVTVTDYKLRKSLCVQVWCIPYVLCNETYTYHYVNFWKGGIAIPVYL